MKKEVENMNQKQELFSEIEKHLLKDPKPSIFLKSLLQSALFKQEVPFTLLSRLTEIDQSPLHHPEGSVWNHTLMVVDQAASKREQSKNPRIFLWSALLHDTGKATTTKVRKGKITSYDHDTAGEELSREFLSAFSEDEEFINQVCLMVRWHMQILYVELFPKKAKIEQMKSQVSIDELGLLILSDRLGRGGEINIQKETDEIEQFVKQCKML